MSIHEVQRQTNIEDFANSISQVEPEGVDPLTKKIHLNNEYEDYRIKSQQANHTRVQAYGQLATALASVLIALFLAIYTLSGPSRQSQADTILKIITSSDQAHVGSNLKAFREAGLIKIENEAVEKLTATAWAVAKQ
jgi:hypothetical protein